MIGECIAKLRKERGMTQENLAEAMGVSPQTISKWENQTTYPDVTLLPVLADFFGVTVDALYGRDTSAKSIRAEDAVDIAMEQIRRIFVGCFYDEGRRESFDQLVEDHRRALKSGENNCIEFIKSLPINDKSTSSSMEPSLKFRARKRQISLRSSARCSGRTAKDCIYSQFSCATASLIF